MKFAPHICPRCEKPHRSNNIPIGMCERCRMRLLGEKLVMPIRGVIDYEGLARRIISVQPIPSEDKAHHD